MSETSTNANSSSFLSHTTLIHTLQHSCSRRILVKLHQVLHIIFAAEEYRASIMNACRNNIKDALGSCGCNTSSLRNIHYLVAYLYKKWTYLFCQESHRE